MSDSTLYTIGTALNRARDNGVPVYLLVEGQWLSGHVRAVDGHGVVLSDADHEHAVVRMESIAAVRISSPAPERIPLTSRAMPMPAPAR